MKHSRDFDISVVKSINTASKIPIGLCVAILFVPCLNKSGNIKFFLLQLHLSKKSFLCTAKHAYSKVLVRSFFGFGINVIYPIGLPYISKLRGNETNFTVSVNSL